MIGLIWIKSEKLRKLIAESKRFNQLSKEVKEKMMEKMKGYNAEEQEKKFGDFFKKENQSEKTEELNNKRKYQELIAKIQEIDRLIKSYKTQDIEKRVQNQEEEMQNRILEDLNKI